MSSPNRNRRRTRLACEALDRRELLATFGVPWHDPSRLSLSFAPDGTAIAGHVSTLSQTLNAQEPAAVWQREILQAFQTWAVRANINIGLVADGGQAFGTSGKSQHDPRFGDIRVGAQAMSPEVLSVSVPNDPAISSTWTGDVLLNSAETFDAKGLDLEAILVHEAGHVFGLGESADPKSPMYGNYTGNEQLAPGDVAALQSLYGARNLDPNEGSQGNDTIGKATQVQFPGGYTGATPLVVYGDIGSAKDVDVYAVKPPSNVGGPITFRLQSAGISLLTTHLTVLDAKGNVLGESQASSDFGDTVSVHLNATSPNATYYVKVQGATHDVFGIGSYGLAVTFDARNGSSQAAIDSVLRGPYQALGPSDIATLFANPAQALLNHGQHDTDLGTATQLVTTPGFAQNSHFETVASLSGPTDVHFYRVQVPNSSNGQGLYLTATLRAVDPNGIAPRVTILDGDRNVVDAHVLANGDGTFTVQSKGLKGGGNYYLRVTSGTAGPSVGNFGLDVQFSSTPASLSTFAAGSLGTGTAEQSYDFYVGESQLFQLLLSTVAPSGTSVLMTLTDGAGNVIGTITAGAGDTVGGDALFLKPGAYTLRFAVLGSSGATVSYTLGGDSISDPIGPTLEDPTLTPIYASPTMPGLFLYPVGVTTSLPYLIKIKPILIQPPAPG